MRLQLRCRRRKIAKPATPKVQTGSVLNSCGSVSRFLRWLSLLIFALTPQGLATFVDVVPVSGSPPPDPDDLTSSTTKSKTVPPPSFIDVLLMFENPHLDFRRMAKQRKKLLRSLRFSSSSRKRRLAACVASTELKAELWPHRHVTSVVDQHVVYLSKDAHNSDTPVVLDTGASFSITPFETDFVTKIVPTSSREMKGIADSLKIQGIGTVSWPIRDVFGRTRTVSTQAFYVPESSIRLFSPQRLFQENQAGRCIIDHLKTTLELPDGGKLEFPFNPSNNLPLMFIDRYEKVGLNAVDIPDPTGLPAVFDVIAAENANLTAAQKELLLWHFRLGHAGLGWVQALMRKRKGELGADPFPPVLPTVHDKAKSCDKPLCEACLLGKQHRRTPGSVTVKAKPEMEMAIRREALHPGDCLSLDQYESAVRGRLPHSYGKEKVSSRLVGGTIAVDHASGYVFLRNQQTLRAGDTVRSLREFQKEASQSSVSFKRFHADNFPFDSTEFKDHLQSDPGHPIALDFSGVGAHHQNAVAERAVKTISYLARSMLLHQLLHWPAAFDLKNWPSAMEQAVFLYNHMPSERNSLAPVELFTGTKLFSYDALSRARVWGCPCYVLDPRLQDGKRIPKFTPRSRRGVYLGVSPKHSTTVGRILNLQTGYISPQYHVVYDEHFTTVMSSRFDYDKFDAATWASLIQSGYEKVLDPEDVDGNVVPFSDWYDDWITTDGTPDVTSTDSSPSVSEGDDDVEVPDSIPTTTIETSASEGAPFDPPSQPSVTRSGRRYAQHQHDAYVAGGNPRQKVRQHQLQAQFEQGLDWSKTLSQLRSKDSKSLFAHLAQHFDEDDGTQEDWSPMAFKAKCYDEDNPSYEQAMNGPNAKGYKEACKKEYDTLEAMGVWEVVTRKPWMNVLPCIWALKRKLYPDGTVKKLKGRICSGGHRQKRDVDYHNDIFSPVVSWSTVRLLLILSVIMNLATLQIDFTSAFVQADIDRPPNFHTMTPKEQSRQGVFMEMPRGFVQPGKVLKLKKSLYGLKQAPMIWFNHLKGKLETLGFVQCTDVDQCLFVSDKVVLLCYVDDCLLYAKQSEDIQDVIRRMRELNLQLDEESSVEGFLGVDIVRDQEAGTITLTQTGLTKRIVSALGCDDLPAVSTPADEILHKDTDGDPATGDFNYASVVGMMWYLYGHSRPDLGFALSQASRFTHFPRRSHELALIRIGQYLKGTLDKGMILRPTALDQLYMDCHVDSDFMGLHGKEPRDDPVSVKSRAGFIISLNNCPLVWSSKLQDSIALSTMMAEYYALSTAMRDVLPLRNLTKTVAKAVGIPEEHVSTFKVTCHEDNDAARTLANLEPGRTTPRSKFYDVKVHWFRSHLNEHLTVQRIDTKDQWADIFTKPLPTETFEFLRKKILGW